jgi:hypothetical protein
VVLAVSLLAAESRPLVLSQRPDESLIVAVVGGQTISFNQISGHIVVDQERVCRQGTQPPLPGVHAKLLIGRPVALTAVKPRELYAAAAELSGGALFR